MHTEICPPVSSCPLSSVILDLLAEPACIYNNCYRTPVHWSLLWCRVWKSFINTNVPATAGALLSTRPLGSESSLSLLTLHRLCGKERLGSWRDSTIIALVRFCLHLDSGPLTKWGLVTQLVFVHRATACLCRIQLTPESCRCHDCSLWTSPNPVGPSSGSPVFSDRFGEITITGFFLLNSYQWRPT